MSEKRGASSGLEQPNPPGMLDGVSQTQMRNFLNLKNKIIRTDEIIERYKNSVAERESMSKQLRDAQTQLTLMESGVRGLKAELQALHQDKHHLTESLRASQEEAAALRMSRESDYILIQQLKAQVEAQLTGKKECEKCATSFNALTDEKEKWKTMYQKLRREFTSFRSRQRRCARKRSSNSPNVSPLISPPYPPVFEEVATPPSVSEDAKSETRSETSTDCLDGRNEIQEFVCDKVVVDKQPDSAGSLSPNTQQANQQLQFRELPYMYLQDSLDLKALAIQYVARTQSAKAALDTEDGDCMIVASEPVLMESRDECVMSIETTQAPSTSDQGSPQGAKLKLSAVDMPELLMSCDMKPSCIVETKIAPGRNSRTDPSCSTNESSNSQDGSIQPLAKISEKSSSQCPSTQPHGQSNKSVSLSTELFGDSDSDDGLSVSDDSSEDEDDDLADRLTSDLTPSMETDHMERMDTTKPQSESSIKDTTQASVKVSLSLSDTALTVSSCFGPSSSSQEQATVTIRSPQPIAAISDSVNGDSSNQVKATEEESPLIPESGTVYKSIEGSVKISEGDVHAAVEPNSNTNECDPVSKRNIDDHTTTTTGRVSSMAMGSKFIVPCVEVESVAADTLSSADSDSEVDISFCDSLPVLSPLPISPVNMDTHDRSLDTPVSPLPVSPSNELTLSPLPQSPNNALQDDITLSPLPPSPSNGRPESCVVSPLPTSPIPTEGSKVITPLPMSPVPTERSKVITPLPTSPEAMRPAFCANSAPLHFADTVPQGIKVPTPCNVVVMVSSQSKEDGSSTPTRSELVVSDGSPFSPPPLVMELARSAETSSSQSENGTSSRSTGTCSNFPWMQVIAEPSSNGDGGLFSEQNIQASCLEESSGSTNTSKKSSEVSGLHVISMEQASKFPQQSDGPVQMPTTERAAFIGPVLPAGHPLENRPTTPVVPTHTSAPAKKQKAGKKKKPFSKTIPKNTLTDTSFDDLLQICQAKSTKTQRPQSKSSAASTLHLSVPPSKRARLGSATSPQSSVPVQACNATLSSEGIPSVGYQLRSRQVEFFELVKRRRKSSGSSESSDSASKPIDISEVSETNVESSKEEVEHNSQKTTDGSSYSVPVSEAANKINLSDGELPSDEELTKPSRAAPRNRPPPPIELRGAEPLSMTTRKRRHTDGATGQEEEQTPSNSPLQVPFLPPPAIAPPDLSKASCGYGPPRQVDRRAIQPHSSKDSSEDIFNTTLSLIGGSSKEAKPPAKPAAQFPALSMAQQQLPVWFCCPLPLPDWLVCALHEVANVKSTAHANVANLAAKKKKRPVMVEPLSRQRCQKDSDYIVANLERLVLGQIHLGPFIKMFANRKNIPSASVLLSTFMNFLVTSYLPSIDAVIGMHHSQCDSIRTSPHDRQPLDPAFPAALLKTEAQLLALFAHLPRMNPQMTTLLSELNTALYQTIVTTVVKFHQLAAAIRLFTGICRLQGDAERVMFMWYDLMRKPLLVNELPVLAGVASVWPLAIARKPGFKVQPGGQVELRDLEKHVLSYTLEVVIMTMIREKASDMSHSLSPHMHTLCGWVQVGRSNLEHLTERLVQLLTSSAEVYINHPPPPPSQWRRPRPSVIAFHIVHALRLISHTQGWVWTNDTLIRKYLWPILQKWNSSEGSEVKDAAVVCVARLIGFVSIQGVAEDPLSSSISQLQRVLKALITKAKTTQDNFSALQLAAVDSLLELCPPTHPRAAEMVGVVRVWLKGLLHKPAKTTLVIEFNSKLAAYPLVP